MNAHIGTDANHAHRAQHEPLLLAADTIDQTIADIVKHSDNCKTCKRMDPESDLHKQLAEICSHVFGSQMSMIGQLSLVINSRMGMANAAFPQMEPTDPLRAETLLSLQLDARHLGGMTHMLVATLAPMLNRLHVSADNSILRDFAEWALIIRELHDAMSLFQTQHGLTTKKVH